MKYLIASIMAVCMMAFAAQAIAPSGGWGQDCSNWVTYADPMSFSTVVDPDVGGGSWYLCPNCPDPPDMFWPDLDVQCWIEYQCEWWWQETSADIHLSSYYDPVFVYFDGTLSCNNPTYVLVTPPGGQSLTALPFVENIWGGTFHDNQPAIPVTWEVSIDGAAYVPLTDPGTWCPGCLWFLVWLCDHSFTIRLTVDPMYHQYAGYYAWAEGGFLCPAYGF